MRRRVRSAISASPGSTSGALAALSKDAARRILNQGHHLSHQSSLQRLGTALGASGPNLLHPHYTPSPLSSATLLASYLKHRILRNLENVSMPIIRRTLDLVSQKNPLWQHSTSQQPRRVQCEQVLEYLDARVRSLQLRLEFDGKSLKLKEELEAACIQQGKLKLLLTCMESNCKGSLHPVSLQQDDRVFLTPSEAAQLPSPCSTLRGLLIRFKGPRRGNRAFKWEKSTGRISTNSVGFIVSEEAKIPIPSKLGVFGMTVRIVYTKRNRLVECRQPLNVVDQPRFSFLKNPIPLVNP